MGYEIMNERKPQMSAYKEFIQKLEEVRAKGEVVEDDFLAMAQQAIATYRADPDSREYIARSMAGLWFGSENIEEGSLIDKIGGEFADLELPEPHIDLGEFNSVEEKWESLAETIQSAAEKDNE